MNLDDQIIEIFNRAYESIDANPDISILTLVLSDINLEALQMKSKELDLRDDRLTYIISEAYHRPDKTIAHIFLHLESKPVKVTEPVYEEA